MFPANELTENFDKFAMSFLSSFVPRLPRPVLVLF